MVHIFGKAISLFGMQAKGYITLRRIGSAFLLVLLLSIHVAKSLHTHSEPKLNGETNKVNRDVDIYAPASTVCEICQFECMREADITEADISIQPHYTYSVFEAVLPVCHYSAPHSYYLYRGPPAIAF